MCEWSRWFKTFQLNGNGLGFKSSNDNRNAPFPIFLCQYKRICTGLGLAVGDAKYILELIYFCSSYQKCLFRDY
jgi:hypothetical protein